MKVFWKMLAVFAAIAAVAAALYCFRDKLKALCPCCGKKVFHPVEEAEDFCEASQEEAPAEAASGEESTQEVSSEDFAD